MPTDLATLNRQFAIPGVAEVVAGNGGLPVVRVTAPDARGEIYLHGGHVTSWTPAGADDVLWCSQKSQWENNKPIRGGVPVCFPWFGKRNDNPALPQHGFARLREWQLESVTRQGGAVTVVVALHSDAESKQLWPNDFILRHRVTFGRELVMQLELANTGKAALTVEEAQHTYFGLGDVRQIKVTGLDGVTYRSDVEGATDEHEQSVITITAETDRVYQDTRVPVTIDDPAKRRRITIHKENSLSTVVWNPWVAKSKAMPDFGDDEWPEMICVETCNVGKHPISVTPGQTHVMGTRVTVDRQ